MSFDRDIQELRSQYANWSTEDLLRVLAASQDYRPGAVTVAREVLATRDPAEVTGLTEPVRAQLEDERAAQARAADDPLSPGLKVMCFLLCGIPGIAFAAYQEAQRRTRRAREAWRWVMFGWAARLVIAPLFFF